jgi:voltage-gated potassium channel
MFFFVDTLKRLRTLRVLKENKRLLLFFLGISLFFAGYMWQVEGLSLIDTYYFLITTATTVGYGDLSPKTDFGKVLVTVYMVVGIALLGLFLGKVTEWMVDVSSRRKKGLLRMKGQVDLIIAGYPSDDKVHTIITELRNDDRYREARIVCVNNELEEAPPWMAPLQVGFVRGAASEGQVLKACGIDTAHTVLILANDPALVESDDHSASICAVVERMHPEIRTIIEKVRKDTLLFAVVNTDTVVDVASPSVLAQEVLDAGAIELQNAIFSTHTEGTQYNYHYTGEDTTWSAIALALLDHDAIPEGFKNPGDRHFKLLPKRADVVSSQALIKYRGTRLLDELVI